MSHKKWDVYVYGDVNIDLVVSKVNQLPQPGQEDVVEYMNTYIGGGAALFTLGVGKLGLHPVFQGKVGDDLYGRFIIEEFRRLNIDSTLIEMSQCQNTGISISFTNKKDRAFLTYRGTNECIDISSIDLNQVSEASHIHLTGYSGRKHHDKYLDLLIRIKQMGNITVSFDLGWDDSGEWYEKIYELFPYIDVLFMNEVEAIHYSRQVTAKEAIYKFSKECKLVVLKLGKRGSMAINRGVLIEQPSYSVSAIDTTGAGDSFNAGFIYAYLNHKSIKECLTYGNGCGALSVMALGGNTGFPDKDTLEKFIQANQ